MTTSTSISVLAELVEALIVQPIYASLILCYLGHGALL